MEIEIRRVEVFSITEICNLFQAIVSLCFNTFRYFVEIDTTQPVIRCSKLTRETLEQGVK